MAAVSKKIIITIQIWASLLSNQAKFVLMRSLDTRVGYYYHSNTDCAWLLNSDCTHVVLYSTELTSDQKYTAFKYNFCYYLTYSLTGFM